MGFRLPCTADAGSHARRPLLDPPASITSPQRPGFRPHGEFSSPKSTGTLARFRNASQSLGRSHWGFRLVACLSANRSSEKAGETTLQKVVDPRRSAAVAANPPFWNEPAALNRLVFFIADAVPASLPFAGDVGYRPNLRRSSPRCFAAADSVLGGFTESVLSSCRAVFTGAGNAVFEQRVPRPLTLGSFLDGGRSRG